MGDGEDGTPKIGRAAHDDAELEAAEARAQELKERFAFATDDRERQEALRLASEATMRVNTMRAARECPPSIARRAADEASRALKDARRMLQAAEGTQEPAVASPPKPDAAERRVRSPGVVDRQSTASNATRSPARPAPAPVSTPPPRRAPTPTKPPSSPSATSEQRIRGDRASSSSARDAPIREANANQESTGPGPGPTAHSPDVEHAAAVRVQRVQRGRAARERVKALSEARRVAAKEKDREAAFSAGATPKRAKSARGASAATRVSGAKDDTRTPPRRTTPSASASSPIITSAPGGQKTKGHAVASASPAFRAAVRASGSFDFSASPSASRRSVPRSPEAAPGTKPRRGPSSSAERAANAAARRLKLRLEADMAAANESALAESRKESRNRRVMYPGEEKFYERLENARAGSAKNRPASAVSSAVSDESRASTPARAFVATRRDASPKRTPKSATPQAPRSAGGSSRASRSLRVSFEAARESPPKSRDVSSNADGGSDPAMRRAEEAERALRAAEAQRAAAEAAVAAARAEAERARREALLGPIPDDSESEYGTLSPLKSFASPTRASRASRSSPFASSAASPSADSAATRSSPVRSARSSLTRSFAERSGLGSSLSSSVFADDLDGAPSAPATPGAFPEDGENRGPSFDSERRKKPAAPRSAPAKTTFSVFGGPLATKHFGGNTPPATDSRALRPPAQKTKDASRERQAGSSRVGFETSTTEKAKAYAEKVRAMAAKRFSRKAAADAEAARRRADVEAERLVRESREGVSEARAGADRAKTLQRDALLYSRDMYRRAATAAFRRYYDMKDAFSNASRATGAFENARFEKELVDAVKSMPAFRGLHPRYLPRLFAGASLATYRERDVVVKEGERGDFAFVLVGGECATFKRRDSAKGMESLDLDPDPWNPDVYPRKTPYRVARLDDTGVPVADRNGPKRAPVLKPGWEIEAKLLGAPPGSGPFARRTRTGDLFGLGAVRGARKGEARCATLVALSETTALIIPKETFDDVIDAVQRGEAAKTAAFLRAAELFPESEVTDADLKALARALERVAAAPGDRVVTAGDVARGVFFVKEGRAEVFAKARVLVDAAGGGGVVVDAFERDKSARDELWDGSVRDSLRDSRGSPRGSLRGSLRLRRGTGTGGGAAGTPLVERVRDVPLGDLVSPAVFGEECLVPREKKAKVVGTSLAPATTPSAREENEKSFGRHAFTVVAARGVGVTVLRLAPGELSKLPASVARRIMQLARSTAEASAEAREALDAPPAPPPGRARDVVASAEFKKAPPPPARVGVVFGSSEKPPPSLVDREASDGEGEARASTVRGTEKPGPSLDRDRDARRSSGNLFVRKGLGGGGGRTRLSGGTEEASRTNYSRSRSPPASWSRLETSADSTPSPYSRFMRFDAPDQSSLDDARFERTAREVTEAALREAKSAERKLRAFRESRRANRKNKARESSAPGNSDGNSGGALLSARSTSRAGADRARRANSAPVVRLTKKAAAIAAKNAPQGGRLRAGETGETFGKSRAETAESFRFRRGASPSAAAAAFAFDADRARGALEASSRSRERAAEARASLRDSSLGRRPRREDFDDFEDAWEDAGRV
jgi:CRP-like cAMP-binding protein